MVMPGKKALGKDARLENIKLPFYRAMPDGWREFSSQIYVVKDSELRYRLARQIRYLKQLTNILICYKPLFRGSCPLCLKQRLFYVSDYTEFITDLCRCTVCNSLHDVSVVQNKKGTGTSRSHAGAGSRGERPAIKIL